MTFAMVEMEVVRSAEDAGVIPSKGIKQQYQLVMLDADNIGKAINDRDIEALKLAIGETTNQLVVLCTLADISLTDCMKLAHERNS